MTEQELRIEFQRISEENNYLQMLNEDDAVDLCKSYANARESKEIAELKAESKYWKDRWEAQNQAHDAEFSSIIAQNAENKRLKDALERVMRHHIDESISILDNYLEMKDIARVAWKASIYPAPVTEGKETANESSKLLQCPHCERMFDPSDENDFCLNGTCDAK